MLPRRLNVRVKWTSIAIILVLTSGCASLEGGSLSKLPIPVCPPEEVALEYGFVEGPTHAAVGQVLLMTMSDSLILDEWTRGWVTCAKARGAVLEQVK